MQRVKRTTAVAVLPAAPGGGTPGYFAAPNPGGGVPATVPGYEWYNDIQEELMAVIEGQSLVPSGADRTQLRQAITAMIAASRHTVIIDGATFNAGVANGNAVYWDAGNNRFDKALADGSVKQNCVGIAHVSGGNVYAFGDTILFAGLTPGARYYLDATTAGAITTVAPTNAVFVGVAKGATEMFVDVDQQPSAGVATGTIAHFAANAAPAGYLKSNGALVSRTTYAALWAHAQASGNLAASEGVWIVGMFSPGDGATTFRIPDLRGEFIRGWDDGRGVDSGRAIGSYQADDFKSHVHVEKGINGGSTGAGNVGISGSTYDGVNTGATGGAETRPRNVALLACIKY